MSKFNVGDVVRYIGPLGSANGLEARITSINGRSVFLDWIGTRGGFLSCVEDRVELVTPVSGGDLAFVPVNTEVFYVGNDPVWKSRGPRFWLGAAYNDNRLLAWGDTRPTRDNGHCSGQVWTWLPKNGTPSPAQRSEGARLSDFSLTPAGGIKLTRQNTETIPLGTELEWTEVGHYDKYSMERQRQRRGGKMFLGRVDGTNVRVVFGSEFPSYEVKHVASTAGDGPAYWNVWDQHGAFKTVAPTPKAEDQTERIRQYLISIAPSHGWCRGGVNRHFKAMGLAPWEEQAKITVEVTVTGTDRVTAGDLSVTSGTGTVTSVRDVA